VKYTVINGAVIKLGNGDGIDKERQQMAAEMNLEVTRGTLNA
jgi:hypothetical protein